MLYRQFPDHSLEPGSSWGEITPGDESFSVETHYGHTTLTGQKANEQSETSDLTERIARMSKAVASALIEKPVLQTRELALRKSGTN